MFFGHIKSATGLDSRGYNLELLLNKVLYFNHVQRQRALALNPEASPENQIQVRTHICSCSARGSTNCVQHHLCFPRASSYAIADRGPLGNYQQCILPGRLDGRLDLRNIFSAGEAPVSLALISREP